MKIRIEEQKEEMLQVVICCKAVNKEVLRLKQHIELFENKLAARKDEETVMQNVAEVLYFESVDNRTFLYTESEVLEVKQRLYELEDVLSEKDFIRISKSQIVNVNKIHALRPELNRTIEATMCNGERLSISRKYAAAVRELLEL
jgi:DNA-binding LytR/AlgR family response regulator